MTEQMEVPEGYRLVRVGVKGRVPYIHTIPEDQLTSVQKRKYEYRKKNNDKLKEYARQYYAKNGDKIKRKIKENREKHAADSNV